MTSKSKKSNKLFWRLLFVLVILFILYRQFPVFFKNTIGTLAISLKSKIGKENDIKWKNLEAGIDICTVTAKNSQATFATDVFLVRFDPAKIHTSVHYEKNLKRAKEVVEAIGSIAAINASFFDPSGKPLGLLVHQGDIIQMTPKRGMLNSGIFSIKFGYPAIFHRDHFNANGITEAIQSMPRLIHDRIIIDKIKNKQEPSRRSGVAIDYEGRIIIFITETHLGGLSFNDLQHLLLKPEFGIRSALNLDGGGSSQLYLKTEKFEKHIPGLVDVPVFLCFSKKTGELN